MKQILFTFLGFLFFGPITKAQDSDRAALIRQLQVLKTAVLKGDKPAVANFFVFPIKGERLKSKIELSGKQSIKIKTLDRKQFLQHYNSIISPELTDFFRQLELEKLTDQQEWVKEIMPKRAKAFCYRTYEVIILENRVELAFFINTRHDIQLSDADYCEEYAEFWQFEWKGGQLRFRSMDIAE